MSEMLLLLLLSNGIVAEGEGLSASCHGELCYAEAGRGHGDSSQGDEDKDHQPRPQLLVICWCGQTRSKSGNIKYFLWQYT